MGWTEFSVVVEEAKVLDTKKALHGLGLQWVTRPAAVLQWCARCKDKVRAVRGDTEPWTCGPCITATVGPSISEQAEWEAMTPEQRKAWLDAEQADMALEVGPTPCVFCGYNIPDERDESGALREPKPCPSPVAEGYICMTSTWAAVNGPESYRKAVGEVGGAK